MLNGDASRCEEGSWNERSSTSSPVSSLPTRFFVGTEPWSHGSTTAPRSEAEGGRRLPWTSPPWSFGWPRGIRGGDTPVRGELLPLGHELARSTVQKILADHGIEPAPERGRKLRWKTFLKAHWELMAAADFFTIEVPSPRGLVRYSIFFVIKLKTRTVHIAGISPNPTGAWMKQLARNLTDAEDGFLGGIRSTPPRSAACSTTAA